MTATLLGVAIAAIVVALIALYVSLLESIYKERLATDEVYLVTTSDLWKIRVCRYRKGRTNGQPVLLVHGANTNQHNFTSPRGGSLVDFLVGRGFDCWTVDLRGCRTSEAPFERYRNQITCDDFLNHDLPTLIRFLQQETGYAKIHYCGHSLGGMLLYAYVLKNGGDAIASAATLGAPPGFEGLKPRYSRRLIRLLGVYPPLVGGILRAAAPLVVALRLNPVVFPMNMRNLQKGLQAEYFYMMLEDPLPGVLDDLLRWVSPAGWKMDGGELDVAARLKDLDIPLFALFAPLDPLIPLDKAQGFMDSIASVDKRIWICSKEKGCKRDYNHCDLAFGKEGQREVFAPIARWFETHTTHERVTIPEPEVATGYQTPLNASQRAEILSGDSFAHLTTDGPAMEAAVEEVAAKASIGRDTAEKQSTPSVRPGAKTPAREGKRDIPGRTSAPAGSPKGPDLAAVSAALTALRPLEPRPATTADEPKFVLKPGQAPKHNGKKDEVETPTSVLKALSNASDALENFKKSPGEGKTESAEEREG